MTNPKTINLALQGGGAHGAFTWGVLDKLLADGRLEFEGISGASAGAVNAVALAHGWAQARDSGRDPAEGAREALARVWNQVTAMGTLSHAPSRMARIMMGALPGAMSRVSPYQTNPLDFNPLRKLLEREIDFERLSRLRKPCVYVSATDVETGRCVVFSGKKLTVQAVVASGCLPLLFQAPEIDGRTYWDGGYSNNPALTPLVERSASRDILLVQITPLRHEGTPRTMAEIVDRINDLTFNASLIAQMRSLGVLNDMVGKGVAPRGLTAIHIHRIDGGAALSVLPAGTKVLPQMSTVQKLFVLGQEAASRWLAQHLGAVGHKSSIDLRRDYGDPLRLNYRPQTLDSASSAAPPAPATAF
ncbi:MAG: patatin-like phospholipase family protein, partial [Burkholderiaceae bacterium]|nr:patatin-like phospholipase family protein [Burkholderiaceae bacterium]